MLARHAVHGVSGVRVRRPVSVARRFGSVQAMHVTPCQSQRAAVVGLVVVHGVSGLHARRLAEVECRRATAQEKTARLCPNP